MDATNRYLVRNDIRPGVALAMLDARPERQYFNQDAQPDLLAALATDRKAGTPLIVNHYRIAADFLIADVLSGLDLEALTDHQREQIHLALWYRILYGFVSMALIDGQIMTLSPRGTWPVMERGQRIGTAFVVPYRTQTLFGGTVGGVANSGLNPDRAVVAEVLDSQAVPLYDVSYSGITIGANFSPAGMVQNIVMMGDGKSFFPAMEPIVEVLDSTLRAGWQIVRRHAHPHIQIPASAVQYNDEGQPGLILADEGMIFPIQRDDKDVQYITLSADTKLMELVIDRCLSALTALTGAPPSLFNSTQFPRLESGLGVQELQATTIERTAVLRAEIVRGMLGMGLTVAVVPGPVDNQPTDAVRPV